MHCICETAFGFVPIMSHASILVHSDAMTSQQLVFLAQLTFLKAAAYVTPCGSRCVRLFGASACCAINHPYTHTDFKLRIVPCTFRCVVARDFPMFAKVPCQPR